MRTYKCLFALIFCFNAFCVNAQEPGTSAYSQAIIRKGLELHDEEKYDEALAEFRKVERNDSNYYLAGVEILNTLLAQGKNTEGLALCDHLLKLKNDYTPNILNFKGDFLDNLGKSDEALKIYKDGAAAYPLNHSFYYEQAVTALRKRKNTEAFDLFVKTIRINPFHSASHYQLALLAYRSKNITATMLAFQFYLLCDPSSKRASGVVVDMEKISKAELESDSVISIPQFQSQNDFTEIESVLRSKVALSKKYKSKTSLNFDLTKQMQLLNENIGKYGDVPGFFSEFYGKFFTELEKNQMFEPFAYNVLSSMGIEQVDKWKEKNKDEIKKFNTWAYNYICREFATFSPDVNDGKPPVPHWYSGTSIQGAGKMNEQGENEGYWNFYYSNGIKRSEGLFSKGKRNGLWKFYSADGGIKEEIVYSNNDETAYKSYYVNTNPHVDIKTENGKISGLRKVYYSNGNLASTTTYKDGKINGPQTFYYRNGALRYTINNAESVLSGDLVEYFDNGKKYQTVKFVNSEREGPGKTYFNNDQNSVATAGQYVKGNKVGEWKEYFRNGPLYKVATYNNDGMYEGEVKEYFENGKLSELKKYSNGTITDISKSYNEDGTLLEELVYRKGKLLEYRAFKKTGEKICDNKINGKNFKLALYHPNGVKRREGAVSDGELTGTWKDYNMYGVLIKESNYVEGNYDGLVIDYHNNGKIKKERHYTKGEENGLYISFYVNGNKESEGMVKDGSYVDTWKFYYKDGTLKSKIFYIDSESEGWSEFYSVSGVLRSENLNKEFCLTKVIYHDTNGVVLQNIDLPGGTGLIERKDQKGNVLFRKNFVKDYADGKSFTYFPDGKTESVVDNKNGKKEGYSATYNPLGQITSEVSYYNDEKNGPEKGFSEDGKLLTNYIYVNGDYHGLCHNYHENGKTLRQITYNWGEAEGESPMYDDAGELVYKRFFHSDLLESYTYKSPTGELLAPKAAPAGETKLTCYFQNGKKSIEAPYLNGDLHGKRSVYHSTGKLIDESNFYYDYRHGSTREFYPSGVLQSTETYYYGSLEGMAKGYYENGKLKWEKNYHNGSLHGWSKYYDVNGNIKKSLYYYDGDAILIK